MADRPLLGPRTTKADIRVLDIEVCLRPEADVGAEP